jgi:hypothetical protein
MGQNFDDYPDFQKIPGMPLLLQHSVCKNTELFHNSTYLPIL